jgi:hypothetical protein
VAGAAITGGHYRINIISGVGHSRSDSIIPLGLYMVAYDIRGTGIILQVPQDNTNPAEKGYYLG